MKFSKLNPSNSFKGILLILLSFGLNYTGVSAGTGSTGGGNAVDNGNGDLFDFAEFGSSNISTLDLSKNRAYLHHVTPVLAKLSKAGLTSLAIQLNKNLLSKPLYLSTSELSDAKCLNNQGILKFSDLGVVACQDQDKIVIQKRWWDIQEQRIRYSDRLPGEDEESVRALKNQGGLLIHEALLAFIMGKTWDNQDRAAAEPTLREVNRLIHAENPDVERIRMLLNRDGFGFFILGQEAQKVIKHFEKTLRLNDCKNYLADDIQDKIRKANFSWESSYPLGVQSDDVYAAYSQIGMRLRIMYPYSEKESAQNLCHGYKNFIKEAVFEGWFQRSRNLK